MNDFNQKVIEEFRANAGKVGGPFEGADLLLLTTTGAKAGRRWTTPVMYLEDGDRLVVIASKAGADHHPAWFHNLRANPEVTVEAGTDTFQARASIVDPPERDRLYARMVEKAPGFAEDEAKASRASPVVALERVGGAAASEGRVVLTARLGPARHGGGQLHPGALQPLLTDRGQLLTALPELDRLLQGEPARLQAAHHLGQLLACLLVRGRLLLSHKPTLVRRTSGRPPPRGRGPSHVVDSRTGARRGGSFHAAPMLAAPYPTRGQTWDAHAEWPRADRAPARRRCRPRPA